MKEQIRAGHYVCVCVSAHQDSCTGESSELSTMKLKSEGIDVYTHDLQRSLNPIMLLKSILSIKKNLKKSAIDAVICHSVLGSIIGRLSAWLCRVEHRIYFCHGLACAPGQDKFRWLIKYNIEHLMAKCTTGMLVMNQYDYRLSKAKKFVKEDQLFMTSGMGVNITKYDNADSYDAKGEVYKELNIILGKKIIICVARLIAQKGVEYYITTAIEICKNREDVCFLLIGDGPLMQKLERLVEKVGFEQQIQLLGWRDDVNRLLKAADIFVLPSYYPEGRSIAILEAMAMGKAVITTNNRGCADSVKNNETGIVIPMHDLLMLEKSIQNLLDDSNFCNYLGENASSYVKKYCNIEYCTRILVKCLDTNLDQFC